jgi:hypothetical protein
MLFPFIRIPPTPPPVAVVRYIQEDWSQQPITKDQIGRSRSKLKLYKESLHISPKIEEIGLGVLLGDASLQTQDNGKTFRLKFEGGDKNRAYIQHLREEFDPWCLSDITSRTRIHPNTGKEITNWSFQTISHAEFKYFAALFLNQVRCVSSIPKGLITRPNFTARSLAYWIMDDGGKMDYGPNQGKGMILHTQAFSKEEVDSLCEGLREKFNLICWTKPDKQYFSLAISGKSYETLMDLICPYVIPSMRSKLPSPRKKS